MRLFVCSFVLHFRAFLAAAAAADDEDDGRSRSSAFVRSFVRSLSCCWCMAKELGTGNDNSHWDIATRILSQQFLSKINEIECHLGRYVKTKRRGEDPVRSKEKRDDHRSISQLFEKRTISLFFCSNTQNKIYFSRLFSLESNRKR